MLAPSGWGQGLIFSLGRDRSPQRNKVLKRSVVVDFDGDPFKSLVAAMRTKSLLQVKRQLETTVTPMNRNNLLDIRFEQQIPDL